ncbi:MAG: hypothetical protein NTX91_00330 [candidate division SR1 bacterium]|nr:hypothetical protein [candidate division SR1 bacterium]
MAIGIKSAHADNLQNIFLDYCNTDAKTLTYTLDTNVDTGICYSIFNNSSQTTTVKVNFVDGTFTNDKQFSQACWDEGRRNNFGQYVTGYQTLVTLGSGESKKQLAKLSYPQGKDGQYYGCITYTIADTNAGESNFAIVIRKAKFINVLVGHPENLTGAIALDDKPRDGYSNLSSNPRLRIYQDPTDNKYMVEVVVKNIGPVEENIVLTGITSNFLMYKETFTELRKILPGEQFIITRKLDTIPNYDLKVDIQLSHTWTIPGRPDIASKTLFLGETTHIYILNIITYATGIGLLLLLLILILLIKSAMRKRRPQDLSGTTIPATTK